MSRSVRLTFAIFGAVAALASGAFPCAAEEFQMHSSRFVANGPVVVLANWTCWFPTTCKYAACRVTTVQKPTLGTLKSVVGPSVVPAMGGQCAGKPIPALTITYTPRPGAHGGDEIVLRSIADNGGRHMMNIHVDVP